MLLPTLLREAFTAERFERVPETDLVMDSADPVSAFVRAARPRGVLSGVYAFYLEQACRMIRPADRVLDLGCGPAALLASLAARNADCAFVGVDLSPGMLAAGRELLRERAAGNVELRLDDMTTLSSIEAGSVDVVLSSMALHHLESRADLCRCFEAIDRVLAPEGRVLLSDFGRLKSLKSVEYFVRRAIPRDEPILECDYRASLRAAFAREEFELALPDPMKRRRVALYATAVSPMMVVLMTPFPQPEPGRGSRSAGLLDALPWTRRADYRQLRLFLRLGGMPIP